MRDASLREISLAIMTASLFAGVGAVAAAEDPPSGAEVVRRHVEAVGGRGVIDRVASFHVTGTYDMPVYGAHGTIELHFTRPDRLLFQVALPGIGSIRRGLVGDTGWSMEPQQPPKVLGEHGLEALRIQAARGFSLLPGSDLLKAGEHAARVEFDGRPCYKVTMTMAGTGKEFTDFYDVESGLFAGRIEPYQTSHGPVEIESVASGYREFAGLLVATRWRHSGAGQEWSAVYETVEFGAVDPAVFEFPAEVAAEIAKTKPAVER